MEPIHLVHEYLVENGLDSHRYRGECGEPLLYVGDSIKVEYFETITKVKVVEHDMPLVFCAFTEARSWIFDLHDPDSLPAIALCLCDTMAHIPDKNGQQKLPLERLWKS